jgi:hypothetical protein
MSPLDTFTWGLMALLMLGRGDIVSGFYALCWLVRRPVGRAPPWEFTRTFHPVEAPESGTESEEESETDADKEKADGEEDTEEAEKEVGTPPSGSDAEEIVVTPTTTSASLWQRCKTG